MNHSRMMHECAASRLFRKRGWMLALSLLLAFAGAQQGRAQNESGIRPLDKRYYTRDWYDSAKHAYWLRVPIITALPPLNSDMPQDVLSAYVHLDSLSRFNTDVDMIQSHDTWVGQPGLLKKTLASHYRAMDYDPLRYQQYEMETAMKSPSRYKTPVISMTRFLPGALQKSLSNTGERNALMSVLLPDYVLRVKVLAVDSVPTNAPYANMSEYICSATVQVLDTIKGRRFPSSPCEGMHGNGSSIVPGAPPCLQLQYYPNNYFPDSPENIYDEDSAFSNSERKFTMPVGQEAVVFLTFIDQKFDSTSDAYLLNPEPNASYNALPIMNGQVRDINHIWSSETMTSYADWKLRFHAMREKILTGTY